MLLKERPPLLSGSKVVFVLARSPFGLFCCVVPSAAHSIRSDPCHRAVVMLLYYTVRVLVKFAYESPCEFVVGNGLVIR